MRIDIPANLLDESRKVRRRAAQPRPPSPKPEVTSAENSEFLQLLHSIYDGVLITDTAGRIVAANVRGNQFFAADPGELQDRNIADCISGADETLVPTIQDSLHSNRFVLIQAFCSRLDGTTFPAEITVNRQLMSGKEHLSFFVRDVTVRKEREEQLRAGYTALQNASSGIAITGNGGTIIYCNRAFTSMLARKTEEELQGTAIADLLREPALADRFRETTASGATWEGELEMVRSDGRAFFAHASVAANFDEDGDLAGMVFSALDITAQRRAQQQLEAYAKELHRRNTQMQEDLTLASELHRAFLPAPSQTFPEPGTGLPAALRVNHLYLPCGTIGGDFLDVRQISDHEVGIFVSDVMGHGVRSSLVVATVRGLLEQLTPVAGNPGNLLTRLNTMYASIFRELNGDVMFATACYAVLNTDTGSMRMSLAGHPSPFVLRRATGDIERLDPKSTSRAAAIGLMMDTEYPSIQIPVARGDVVLIHTDGIAEVEGRNGALYETERLPELLRERIGAAPTILLEDLVSDARKFAALGTFEDDVCLVAAEILPR